MFAEPNCTRVFQSVLPPSGVTVQMGPVLDGVAEHMEHYGEDEAFRPADESPVDVAAMLRESRAEVLVCYLPVGSERAVRHYARACLEAGVAMVNCVPVFLASDAEWANRFRAAGLPNHRRRHQEPGGRDHRPPHARTPLRRPRHQARPDLPAQHRGEHRLSQHAGARAVFVRRSDRKPSRSRASSMSAWDSHDIHIGPSDYVPWQDDNKIAFIRLEGRGFGDVPARTRAQIVGPGLPQQRGRGDRRRAVRQARSRAGTVRSTLEAPSAYYMKSPPRQDARRRGASRTSAPSWTPTGIRRAERESLTWGGRLRPRRERRPTDCAGSLRRGAFP